MVIADIFFKGALGKYSIQSLEHWESGIVGPIKQYLLLRVTFLMECITFILFLKEINI